MTDLGAYISNNNTQKVSKLTVVSVFMDYR